MIEIIVGPDIEERGFVRIDLFRPGERGLDLFFFGGLIEEDESGDIKSSDLEFSDSSVLSDLFFREIHFFTSLGFI